MTKIPKIIHQIWLGNKTRPDLWMNNIQEFCKHFNYEYVLWTEEKLKSFDIINLDKFNDAVIYAQKADILRYEILYSYGGIYIDADCVIVKPEKFNDLVESFTDDCILGREAQEHEWKGGLIANTVIFSSPKSDFMDKCIKELPHRNLKIEPWLSTGPQLVTDVNVKFPGLIQVLPKTILYPRKTNWQGITDINMFKSFEYPEESLMFHHGYTTNELEKYIK